MGVSPGSIHAGYRLLERLFPSPPLESVTTESLETLSERYKKLDRRGNWIGFLVFLAAAGVYYVLIAAWAGFVHQRVAGARHLLHPFEVEYVVYAVFLSLVSSIYLVIVVLRLLLGPKEYAIYMAYCGQRMPWHFHLGKAFLCFFLVLFPIVAAVTVLRVSMYTAFTDQEMHVSSFGSFGVPRTHQYADVRGIYFIKMHHARFSDIPNPHFAIAFKDGYVWESDSKSGGAKLEKEKEVVEFVMRQTGQRMVAVNFPDEIPK
jgi:hypothetical protein